MSHTGSYKRERYSLTHCCLFYDNLICRFPGMFPSVISGRRRVLSLGPPLTTLITATPTVRSRTCVPTRYRRAVLGPSGLVTITWGHIKGKMFHSGQAHKKMAPFVTFYGYKNTRKNYFEITKSPLQRNLHRWVMYLEYNVWSLAITVSNQMFLKSCHEFLEASRLLKEM